MRRPLRMTCLLYVPGASKSAACGTLGAFSREALPTAAVACAQALALIKQLYGIERVASDRQLDAPARQGLRQEQARPVAGETAEAYLLEQRAAAEYRRSPLSVRLPATHCAIGPPLTHDPLHRRRKRLKIDNNGAEQAFHDRSCWAGRTGCSRAVKRQRTGPPSCVHSSRPASTCRSIPSSTCAMSSSAFRPIRRDWSWN